MAAAGKRTFGLLGEKLSHSFSPQIHAMLGDYEYRLFEIPPGELEKFLRMGDFDGLNVTIPYKRAAMSCCDVLSDRARRIGSVNTLFRMPGGGLFGDNTDYDGFLHLVRKLGAPVAGNKAVVLGSGGSSLAVRAVLEDLGAGEIVTVSRSGPDNYENIGRHFDARVVVNTTPVGMYPDNGRAPVDISGFNGCEAVIDIIYNPLKTALLLDAEELGIPCANGLSMLVAQAKRSSEIFTGKKIDDGEIERITGHLIRRMQNVFLMGMPGCGKTTVGRILAQITGRPFYDTDELIEKRAGRIIPEIFSELGEEAFRRLETEALEEVSKKSGAIIATGGGVVKRPENRRLIRQNGVAVFLERDLSKLPTEGRPLSARHGVEALYRERLPLYLSWSDCKVPSEGLQETAKAIKEMLGL